MNDKYIVYGGTLSYFTMKLISALRFYGVEHELRAKSGENRETVESRSGTHQVPVLQTPENWMIGDTTPLLDLLDQRYPWRRMFPVGPLGVLVQVVEEFFDEWVARTMVHYRWHYPETALFAATRMVAAGNPGADRATLEAAATQIANWGGRACRATGTDSKVQQQAAEDEYERILVAMEAQLKRTRYLLGDRPSAIDCIMLGGLRAHTWHDPEPKKLVGKFPGVVAWCEEKADRWDGEGELAPFPDGTDFTRMVVAEAATSYKPFVLGNRNAVAAGAKAFQASVYGEEVSYLTREYPERSRRMITSRITNRLTQAEQEAVFDWLQATGLADCFAL